MVNVPWCRACDEPSGLCRCSRPEKVELQPGWLDRIIQEAKKSLPTTEQQLAAALIRRLLDERDEAWNKALDEAAQAVYSKDDHDIILALKKPVQNPSGNG